MKKWKINVPDAQLSRQLAANTGLSEFICRILVSRGITSRESADIFFNSIEISDPFDIKDMDKAVETINEAVENDTKIMIYGDYDCDGVTSTYILYSYLYAMGADVHCYIPTRDEGYGLNIAAIDLFKKQGVGLIITVDNGISAVDEAEHIKELGMKLIITDHHEVPEKLPYAEAIVNPHRPDDISLFKELAGCGVALKLVMAMEGDCDSIMEQFADVAAIGTVADIVCLKGENRIIVREGLRNLRNTENIGLLKLISVSGIDETAEITSSDVGFKIGPRINCAGRCATPKIALDLLLCENPSSAASLANELNELNVNRKSIVENVKSDIDEMIKNDPDILNKRVIVVAGEGWLHGVIGLASSDLLKKYGKPNIVITKLGEKAIGSARSIQELSICKLLEGCSDTLVRFGGHTKAAGLTVETSRIPEFLEAVESYCDKNAPETCVATVEADMEIRPEEITVENISLIKNLEPFGEGNREPLFYLPGCVIQSKKPMKEGAMISYYIAYGQGKYNAKNFNMSFDASPYNEGDVVDIIAHPFVNEYNDKETVQFIIDDMRFSGIDQNRYFAALTAYEDYRAGKIDKRLLCRMIPEKAEMKKVYDILKSTTALTTAEVKAIRENINLCKFRIILDVFRELGLIETDVTVDSVKLLPVSGKVDLESSKIIAALKAAG